jgi:hypothetical protein
MVAPDLSPPLLSAAVPTVAKLLDGASLQSGARPGLPGLGLDDATHTALQPLTAASVDDPVAVLEQPAPRYPPAFERAGVSGDVELE